MREELVRYEFSGMTRAPRALWLVKRGPRGEHHQAPFHPVVICTRKHTAQWEAGWTGMHSWVWEHEATEPHSGWLLTRWNGLVVDYGHIVRGCTLPDGTHAGFLHRHRSLGYDRPGEPGANFLGYADEVQEPWTLLRGAVWWSDHPMPRWLCEEGVVLAHDRFTQGCIWDDDGACALGEAREMKLKANRGHPGISGLDPPAGPVE